MENCEMILKKALLLKPLDRYTLVDRLLQSLDEPDQTIDNLWAEEASRRLELHRAGKSKSIPYEDIFPNQK